jgi:endonuclease YncB( thermonuclease family)
LHQGWRQTTAAVMRVIRSALLSALILTNHPGPAAPARVVSSGATFTCTPVALWDGDGPIWCAEGPKIRIAGVASREMDGSCSPGHPCPTVPAIVARDRLVRLLGGSKGTLPSGHVKVRAAPLTCVSDGSAGGSRTAAWCSSPVVGDLSCSVVRSGGALRWPRYWGKHRCP